MKQTGKCPKCGSGEIMKQVSHGEYLGLGATLFHGMVSITNYICLNCGYVEQWIDRETDLVKLRARFGSEDS